MARQHSTTLEQEPGKARSPITQRPVGPKATLLLVEDEDAVRRVAGEILTAAGHLVLQAKNGQEALNLLRRLGGTLDLLVADVVMPNMNGPELAKQLSLRYPAMKTIFISGYPEHQIMGKSRANAFYLYKPFSVEALTRIVAHALALK